jgi:hypothetical protein
MRQLIQRYPITGEVVSFFFLLFVMLCTSMLAGQLVGRHEMERMHQELLAVFGRHYPFFLIALFPWIETLLFQALPAVIGQIYISQPAWRWLILAVPFGLVHYDSSAVVGSLFGGLSGGVILGYSYLRYMPSSHFLPMLVTWLLHALANACILLT